MTTAQWNTSFWDISHTTNGKEPQRTKLAGIGTSKQSNLYFTRGIMPKCATSSGARRSSLRLSAWTKQFRRKVEVVASRWRHYDRFDKPGNRTLDLQCRWRSLKSL